MSFELSSTTVLQENDFLQTSVHNCSNEIEISSSEHSKIRDVALLPIKEAKEKPSTNNLKNEYEKMDSILMGDKFASSLHPYMQSVYQSLETISNKSKCTCSESSKFDLCKSTVLSSSSSPFLVKNNASNFNNKLQKCSISLIDNSQSKTEKLLRDNFESSSYSIVTLESKTDYKTTPDKRSQILDESKSYLENGNNKFRESDDSFHKNENYLAQLKMSKETEKSASSVSQDKGSKKQDISNKIAFTERSMEPPPQFVSSGMQSKIPYRFYNATNLDMIAECSTILSSQLHLKEGQSNNETIKDRSRLAVSTGDVQDNKAEGYFADADDNSIHSQRLDFTSVQISDIANGDFTDTDQISAFFSHWKPLDSQPTSVCCDIEVDVDGRKISGLLEKKRKEMEKRWRDASLRRLEKQVKGSQLIHVVNEGMINDEIGVKGKVKEEGYEEEGKEEEEAEAEKIRKNEEKERRRLIKRIESEIQEAKAHWKMFGEWVRKEWIEGEKEQQMWDEAELWVTAKEKEGVLENEEEIEELKRRLNDCDYDDYDGSDGGGDDIEIRLKEEAKMEIKNRIRKLEAKIAEQRRRSETSVVDLYFEREQQKFLEKNLKRKKMRTEENSKANCHFSLCNSKEKGSLSVSDCFQGYPSMKCLSFENKSFSDNNQKDRNYFSELRCTSDVFVPMKSEKVPFIHSDVNSIESGKSQRKHLHGSIVGKHCCYSNSLPSSVSNKTAHKHEQQFYQQFLNFSELEDESVEASFVISHNIFDIQLRNIENKDHKSNDSYYQLCNSSDASNESFLFSDVSNISDNSSTAQELKALESLSLNQSSSLQCCIVTPLLQYPRFLSSQIVRKEKIEFSLKRKKIFKQTFSSIQEMLFNKTHPNRRYLWVFDETSKNLMKKLKSWFFTRGHERGVPSPADPELTKQFLMHRASSKSHMK